MSLRNWVLDADIRGYFDTINHEWLMKFVEHRVGDKRVLRLIQKWLSAGVLEAGRWTASEEGTPQGATVSPLLANIYLHYVLDLWVRQWRKQAARGEVVITRWADDFVVGFQHRDDAERFQEELRERLRKFSLELHPEKTRLIEFGRYAQVSRAARGEKKAETFDFLGFTHICGKSRQGKFLLKRQTIKKRMRAQVARGETRTATAPASAHQRAGAMAKQRRARPLRVLRGAHQQPSPSVFPKGHQSALAAHAAKAQRARPDQLGCAEPLLSDNYFSPQRQLEFPILSEG